MAAASSARGGKFSLIALLLTEVDYERNRWPAVIANSYFLPGVIYQFREGLIPRLTRLKIVTDQTHFVISGDEVLEHKLSTPVDKRPQSASRFGFVYTIEVHINPNVRRKTSTDHLHLTTKCQIAMTDIP